MEKKTGEEIGIEEPISNLKWIGPYLTNRLREWNILTCEDMVEQFLYKTEEWEGLPQDRRKYVTEWLEELMKNERSKRCVQIESKIRNNRRYGYKVRKENFMAFNAIVELLKYHAPRYARKYIPKQKTGQKSDLRKYPEECRW